MKSTCQKLVRCIELCAGHQRAYRITDVLINVGGIPVIFCDGVSLAVAKKLITTDTTQKREGNSCSTESAGGFFN